MPCALCNELNNGNGKNTEDSTLIKKYQYCSLVFNRYPYTIGHMMILSNRHVPKLSDLNDNERNEIFSIASMVESKIIGHVKHGGKYVFEGINIGINIGKYAGGSIPTHLHVHLVPRRENDTNFMHTISNSFTSKEYDLDVIRQILEIL